MKFAYTFSGRVECGRLKLDNRERFIKAVSGMNGAVELSIRRKAKHRSNVQNAYYWAVVIPILSSEFGYTHDEMHDALKFQFLRKRGEKGPETCRSTADLSTVEFMEYVQQIQIWAATEFGVHIPDPNEVESESP